MIREILNGARRLDETLQAKLGRPYNILLSVGLVTEIVRSVREFPHHALEASRIAGGIVMLLIETALLLHQLGALSHRFHRRGGPARAHSADPDIDPAPASHLGRGRAASDHTAPASAQTSDNEEAHDGAKEVADQAASGGAAGAAGAAPKA